MLYSFSLYGLHVQTDFDLPFLNPLESNDNIDLVIRNKNSLKFKKDKDIAQNETLSDLNLKTANIENKYYKCKVLNGSLIEYKFKEEKWSISLLMNFLHMPFAFAMFQRGYLPIHGMSFLHKNKTVICLGESGSGKSSLSSMLAKTHKIRSEDITCIIYKNEKIYSMPSFPITLSEENYSKHLKKISSEKISRNRTINHLFDKYDNEALVEVKFLYVLEWGDSDEIRELDDAEALQKLLISSFKPYPFNSCIESEKIYFKNLMGLIRHNKIYLWKRRKNPDISLDPKIIRHIENDSS